MDGQFTLLVLVVVGPFIATVLLLRDVVKGQKELLRTVDEQGRILRDIRDALTARR